VSKDAVEILGRLSDELIVHIAERAVELSIEVGAKRVDVEDVLQAWMEKVIIKEDVSTDDGGPRLHVGCQTHVSLAPRPLPKTAPIYRPKTLAIIGNQHEVD
jgi:hypothetical protein